MQSFQDADEFIAKSILERDTLRSHPARHEQDFLMFYIDHIDLSNTFRELERLMFRERLGREPTLPLLPDHGRIEAFFNRRPDRKIRRELIAINLNVRSIADTNLFNFLQYRMLRVALEHTVHAGFHAATNQRKQA